MARVGVDFIDVTRFEWFLEFGDDAWVGLVLSNAAVRLWGRFALYVVGVWREVFKALEVYGWGVTSWRRLGWFLCLEA